MICTPFLKIEIPVPFESSRRQLLNGTNFVFWGSRAKTLWSDIGFGVEQAGEKWQFRSCKTLCFLKTHNIFFNVTFGYSVNFCFRWINRNRIFLTIIPMRRSKNKTKKKKLKYALFFVDWLRKNKCVFKFIIIFSFFWDLRIGIIVRKIRLRLFYRLIFG